MESLIRVSPHDGDPVQAQHSCSNKHYKSMESRNSFSFVSTNSPLSLTPKHEACLNIIHRKIISSDCKNTSIQSKILSTKPTASLFSSISNLVNSIIGAGVLGLPFAMSKAGVIAAFILLLFFASLTFLSLYFLMYCSKHFPLSGHSSFYSLSMVFLPKPFRQMMDVCIAFNCFGFMVSYLIISGDMFESLAQQFISDHNSIFLNRQILISTFVIIFILPIVQFKHLDSFKFLSFIAILCFVWITFIIVLYAIAPYTLDTQSVDTDINMKLFPSEFLIFISVIPIYTFGFLCHQNAFSITNELSNNTMKRLNIINASTIGVVFVIYASVSFCSYYSFGDYILSDALDNYPKDKVVFIITKMLLVIAILFSFPCSSHPARDSISSLLFKVKAEQLNKCRYNILTYIIVLVAYVIALLVNDLAIVFGFIGATAGTIISYIYPGLIYYYMFKDNPSHRISCILALSLTSFGCILMPFALVCIFMAHS